MNIAEIYQYYDTQPKRSFFNKNGFIRKNATLNKDDDENATLNKDDDDEVENGLLEQMCMRDIQKQGKNNSIRRKSNRSSSSSSSNSSSSSSDVRENYLNLINQHFPQAFPHKCKRGTPEFFIANLTNSHRNELLSIFQMERGSVSLLDNSMDAYIFEHVRKLLSSNRFIIRIFTISLFFFLIRFFSHQFWT